MRTLSVVTLLLVLVSLAPAQTNRDDLTPLDISYKTTVLEDLKTLRVDVDVRNICRPTTRLAMPNWTPGAYRIGRYGERVEDLVVVDGTGRNLDIIRIDHQTWTLATDKVDKIHVSYTVKQNRNRFSRGRDEATTGIHFSGPSTYMYVVGAKNVPVSVRYVLPKGWRVANGLLATEDPAVRRARDYDTFIDAPTIVGIFKDHHFEVQGTPFTCVFFANNQKYEFDIEAFVDICNRIVVTQGRLFGSFPFPNYVFLFSVGGGGGGLEHLNSTSIGLSRGRMSQDVKAGASVTAHEFFHTWNVKRIRPKTLGPFEYEHENYTGNLWVSEGWTSYYGDLTMARAGIISHDAFLGKLQSAARREFNKAGRKKHSVYWASRTVWHRQRGERGRVDYYAKGELLGALIDLKIRHETDNKKSLDDVMRFFNHWFAERNVGFEENDVERACTAISNHDFSEFFARHVFGTLDPPMAEYLAHAGIVYSEKNDITTDFPFAYRQRGEFMRVMGGDPLARGNDVLPRSGDQITAIDGNKSLKPISFLKNHKPGEKISISFLRNEKEIKTTIKLQERKRMTPTLEFIENPTEKQLRIRESWLSGN